MGAEEIKAFLTHPAVDKNVATVTQNQALKAILAKMTQRAKNVQVHLKLLLFMLLRLNVDR